MHPDLLALDNVVLTPHIGSSSVPTRRAMAEHAADNLIAALDPSGARTPPSLLNPQALARRTVGARPTVRAGRHR